MKRLMLLRHAKAVSTGRNDDESRDLEPRGLRDAATAGDHIAAAGWAPDLALVSPANRTRQTFDVLAPRLASLPRLQLEPRLYDASPETILALIAAAPTEVACLLVIGHNPGIAQTVVRLSLEGAAADRARIAQGFPTAALAVISLPGDDWTEVAGGGTLDALLLP